MALSLAYVVARNYVADGNNVFFFFFGWLSIVGTAFGWIFVGVNIFGADVSCQALVACFHLFDPPQYLKYEAMEGSSFTFNALILSALGLELVF